MNLENKVHNNIFKRIARRAIPYILTAGFGLATIGCPPNPGPISVKNTISPTSVPSGGNLNWEVEVTNYGGKVKIERVTMHEKAISGWAVGKYDMSIDLPITNDEIDARSTETIFSRSGPVYNIGGDGSDITIENSVTVNSDGGNDSDTTTYTIRNFYSSYSLNGRLEKGKEYSKANSEVVQGLSDYIKESK